LKTLIKTVAHNFISNTSTSSHSQYLLSGFKFA